MTNQNGKINQTIIILEGIDNVGKTAIGKELSKRISIPYFKNNQENDKNYDSAVAQKYTAEFTTQIFEQTNLSVIMDRFWISEFAYSKAFNRQTFNNFEELDKRLSELNSIIIIFDKERKNQIEENASTKRDYRNIKTAYVTFHLKSVTDTMFFNSDKNKYINDDGTYKTELQVDDIIEQLKTIGVI